MCNDYDNDLLQYGAEQLGRMAMTGQIDIYAVIDELARRIRNRRASRRPENHMAIHVYARLASRFNYKPLRPPRRL